MDKFNEWMKERNIPHHRSNLESRILAAAVPFKKTSMWSQIAYEFFAVFVIPKPAYAMAVLIVFGVALGLQIDMQSADALVTNSGSFEMIMGDLSIDDYTILEGA
jgi:hypothetical protein